VDSATAVEEKSLTYACPIAGCEWKLHLPYVPQLNAFMVGLAALEVLAHVIGRYGENGRTPHDAAEVANLDLRELVAAAFPNPGRGFIGWSMAFPYEGL